MVNLKDKKVLVGGVLVLGVLAYLYMAKKKKDAMMGGKAGFKADGTPRALTDAEVISYLANNKDLEPFFTKNVAELPEKDLTSFAKRHWLSDGSKENRKVV